MIRDKQEGREITRVEKPSGGAKVIDLMEALRASLKNSGAADEETEKPRRAAAAVCETLTDKACAG